MLKKALLITVAIAQIAILSSMALERENILRQNESFYLVTTPIDPRDPFRGDYVRLNYAISNIKEKDYQGQKPIKELKKHEIIYTVLKLGKNNTATLSHATDQKPQSGLFIRGRLKNRPYSSNLRIKYGLEKYFVQQNKGKELENSQRWNNNTRIPLLIEVAANHKGTAVIKSHKFAPLSLSLTQHKINKKYIPKVTLTLKNNSDKTAYIANPGNNCSFQLIISDPNIKNTYTECNNQKTTLKDLLPLAPQHTYQLILDLNDTRWHTIHKNKTLPISQIKTYHTSTIRYQPPNPTQGLPDHFWTSPLESSRIYTR